MLGMLGITENAMWIIVIVVVFAVVAFIMLGFYASQRPGGFGWELFQELWYDMLYFFFGPRFGEV